MEIDEDQPNGNKQRLLILCKGVGPRHLPFGTDSDAGRRVGKLYSWKGGDFRGALIGGCWPEGAAGELPRSRPSHVIGYWYITNLAFPGGY